MIMFLALRCWYRVPAAPLLMSRQVPRSCNPREIAFRVTLSCPNAALAKIVPDSYAGSVEIAARLTRNPRQPALSKLNEPLLKVPQHQLPFSISEFTGVYGT